MSETTSGQDLNDLKEQLHGFKGGTAQTQGHGVVSLDLSMWIVFPIVISIFAGPNMRHGLVFRGQRDATWRLESTLDRLLRAEGVDTVERNSVLTRHLEHFKRAVRGRRGPNPARLQDEDDWWALGQHHDLATPLLDWTESPYVGAFFAFEKQGPGENQSARRVVFGLSEERLGTRASEVLEEVVSLMPPQSRESWIERLSMMVSPHDPEACACLLRDALREIEENIGKQVEGAKPLPSHVSRMAKSLVMANGRVARFFRPQSDENPRLINQSGLFTRLPDSAEATDLESHIRTLFPRDYSELVLMKILLPDSERVQVLQDLHRMNIHHASLFPDLSGAGHYCNLLQSVYSADKSEPKVWRAAGRKQPTP